MTQIDLEEFDDAWFSSEHEIIQEGIAESHGGEYSATCMIECCKRTAKKMNINFLDALEFLIQDIERDNAYSQINILKRYYKLNK
jgi:hypothetical protein